MNPNEARTEYFEFCGNCKELINTTSSPHIRADLMMCGKKNSAAVGAYFCSVDCLTIKVQQIAERTSMPNAA